MNTKIICGIAVLLALASPLRADDAFKYQGYVYDQSTHLGLAGVTLTLQITMSYSPSGSYSVIRSATTDANGFWSWVETPTGPPRNFQITECGVTNLTLTGYRFLSGGYGATRTAPQTPPTQVMVGDSFMKPN